MLSQRAASPSKGYIFLLSSTAHNLIEASRKSGCPACRLEQRAVERYLDNHFYENVNSPSWRKELRASLGFCHEHAWLGVNRRLGDALGYSIIYHDVLSSILHEWNDRAKASSSSRRHIAWLQKLLAALAPRKQCPVCSHRDETRRRILSSLVKEVHTPELRQALETGEGLCLPHLKLTLESSQVSSVQETLLTIHRARLEGLQAELAEFIRKSDYRIIKEGFGSEGDAWLRAISLVVGPKRET
jgi:hypothetical protein